MEQIERNVARGEALSRAICKINDADKATVRLSTENFAREGMDRVSWKPVVRHALPRFSGMTGRVGQSKRTSKEMANGKN